MTIGRKQRESHLGGSGPSLSQLERRFEIAYDFIKSSLTPSQARIYLSTLNQLREYRRTHETKKTP